MSNMTLLSAVFAALLYFLINVKYSWETRRMAKGRDVRKGQLPFQVLLEYKPVHPYRCGGVIIDKYHILTAASCVKHVARDTTYATAGIVNINDNSEWRVSERISKWYKHERYWSEHKVDKSHLNISNDIAIGRVEKPFPFNEFIQAVQIPTTPVKGDLICDVSGWGKTSPSGTFHDNLHTAKIPLVNTSYCKENWSKWMDINSGMKCVGYMHGESVATGVCFGDEGGVVMCEGKLTGIVARGSWNCGQPKYVGLYSDVFYYADWIKSTLEKSYSDLSK